MDRIYLDNHELCRRSLTALAKCGDLSCDNSIVSYCQQVWNIKSVEVPNPALNPVHRVRSHSYLHMQESGSLERGDDSSYHSNMFAPDGEALPAGQGGTLKSGDINSFDSKSGESLDKVFKPKNFDKRNAQGMSNSDQDFQNKQNRF